MSHLREEVDEILQTIARLFKEDRIRRKLSQDERAWQMSEYGHKKYSQAVISRIENAAFDSNIENIKTLADIAEAMGMDPSELYRVAREKKNDK